MTSSKLRLSQLQKIFTDKTSRCIENSGRAASSRKFLLDLIESGFYAFGFSDICRDSDRFAAIGIDFFDGGFVVVWVSG